jgi:hypothetical protein
VQPRKAGADVQVFSVENDTRTAAPPLAHIVYARMQSSSWGLGGAPVTAAMRGTIRRTLSRGAGHGGDDNSTMASDPSGGAYVNAGTTHLHQPTSVSIKTLARASLTVPDFEAKVDALRVASGAGHARRARAPSGDSASSSNDLCEYERKRVAAVAANAQVMHALGLGPNGAHPGARAYDAPYRHKNGRNRDVQELCDTTALVMGAAARVIRRALPTVYNDMWAPTRAAPTVGMAYVYPTPAQQQGDAHGSQRREWDVRDDTEGGDGAAAIPTGHVAVRVSGLADGAGEEQRRLVALGISNSHIDRVDAPRRGGVPIVYVPQVSAAVRAARAHGSKPTTVCSQHASGPAPPHPPCTH